MFVTLSFLLNPISSFNPHSRHGRALPLKRSQRVQIPGLVLQPSISLSNDPGSPSALHFMSPEISFLPSLTSPDPTVALAVNGIGYLALSLSNQKSLTPAGLANSAVLGLGLWTFLGAGGWSICVAYLILGSLVTKNKMAEKESLGIAEKRGQLCDSMYLVFHQRASYPLHFTTTPPPLPRGSQGP